MRITGISALFFAAAFILNSCGQTSDHSKGSITLCTKNKCCCPDSIEIDFWDKHLGMYRIEPRKLSTENKYKVINLLPAAESIDSKSFDPKYVIRAYYGGEINPRIIYISHSSIREPANPDALNWFDTGIENLGDKLYHDKSLE